MNSLIAVVVLLTIYFTRSSHALQCYQCIFFNESKHSDPTCQNEPSAPMLGTCDYDLPPGQITVCLKITGILDGKPALIRDCGVALKELVGTCHKNNMRIGESSTNDGNACICSGERCNGATVATFNWAATVATAILHTFYKVMSVGGQ